MHPEDIEKTAFASHKGKFEFIRKPFGLCNAQATFQRTKDEVVQTVQDTGVEAYVDNLLVFTETFEEHLETLENLFHQVSIANLSLRKDKCEFAKPEIEFLGFIIDGQKVRPTPENIRKVMKFPSPTKRKEVQRFLGVANFNRKCIFNFSEIAAPQRRLVGAGWELCRVYNRRTQGARGRPPPPPQTADGYLPMTAYNTTAES